MGALLYVRKLSSMVITIAFTFIWTGLGVTIQPSPGGDVPAWLQRIFSLQSPIVPFPVIFLIVLAIVGHLVLFKTNFGVLLRGIGGNAKAAAQSGHSIAKRQAVIFGLVGLFGILAGASLAAITTSADANIAANYTLLSIAGVMLGGVFVRGRQSLRGRRRPGSLRHDPRRYAPDLLKISPDWQIGSQGLILLLVLFLNGLVKSRGVRNV